MIETQTSLYQANGPTHATVYLVNQVLDHLLPHQRVLELGCGGGEALCQILQQRGDVQVAGIERVEAFARRAQARLQEGVIRTADLRQYTSFADCGSYDHVFCNPPFWPVGKGRLPADPLRAASRFELNGGVDAFIQAAVHMLRVGGFLHMIHLAIREAEIAQLLLHHGLTIHQVRHQEGGGSRGTLWVLFRACKEAEIAG
ncbi:MAG: methyltransferase [Magnetococcales bacterium]|nr:methyltransferase [Magnetococcales bacterium]NGZ29523.1 methyltransferase [Magnetococcales bacterium]